MNKFNSKLEIIVGNPFVFMPLEILEKSVERNVIRAINFLLGKERFVGRDRP